MVDSKKPAHLKLVKLRPETITNSASGYAADIVQAELFPMAKPWLMIFADASEISADNFVTLLYDVRPTFVLDTRPAPRFDMERINRQQVFEIFRDNNIQYVDVAGLVGVASRWDANLNPTFLTKTINANLQRHGGPTIQGPIIILYDNKEFLNSAIDVFPRQILKNEKFEWEVYLAPSGPTYKTGPF